ncbi:MAG: MATE family efflux transporter [Synergistaceae bacterium]|jgi:putative MATE family efflux protein|nr:MATE family efflux transporter [Synergistaceae bacterium]
MKKAITQKQQDLGEAPVMKLLLRLSLPSMGMMFLNTLVFLADSIYVSWLGEDQIAAMSLSLPVAIAFFALMEGVVGGTTALVGQNLGMGNQRMARLIAVAGLTLAYALCVPMLPLFSSRSSAMIFEWFGAMGNTALLRHAYLYNFWWPVTAPLIAYTFVSNSVFRCQGDAVTPLISMTIANVVNVILDPIFIFSLGMGVEGAAIATLIGRVAASAYLYFRMRGSGGIFIPVIPNPRRIFLKYWKSIASIGFPVTLSTGSVALGFGWLNKILAGFGNYAVVALMMSLRIEDFSFTIIAGVATSLTPFLAFNYGRRDLRRMTDGMKAAAAIAGVASLSVGSILFVFPRLFIDLFRPTPEAAEAAVLSIRYAITSYPFVIAQLMMNSLFVATGYSAFGTIAQLVRSLVVRVPAAYLLASLWGIGVVWAYQPASWFFAAIVSAIFLAHLIRKIKNDFLLEKIKSS